MKPASEFYKHASGRRKGNYEAYCRSCYADYRRDQRLKDPIKARMQQSNQRYLHQGAKPMNEAKESTVYLGVYVAERALSKFFDSITRMPYGNPGYDFICGKGYKIDVKSSCLMHRPGRSPNWYFVVGYNKVPDYFLCLGFDNRRDLTPLHVWLVPGNLVNTQKSFSISDIPESKSKWIGFERPIDRVLPCGDKLKR